MSFFRKLKALPHFYHIWRQFVNSYSWPKGGKVFNQIYRSRESRAVGTKISVELANENRKVTLRRGTTDADVFYDLLIKKTLQVPFGINPKLIIDCGAYVGYSPIFFAQEYPDAEVLAVEANPDNYALLEKNVAAFPTIKPIHAAIFTNEGFVELEDPADEAWAYRIKSTNSSSPNDNSSKTNRVRATTIQHLLSESGRQQIDLIKLDIEGAEFDLFESGDLGWLEHTRVLLIECHDNIRPGCSELIHKKMVERNFQSIKTPAYQNTLYHKLNLTSNR